MGRVAYYVRDVPAVPSTTRYNHALALADRADEALLVTRSTPPDAVADAYDAVETLAADVDPDAPASAKLVPRAKQARRAMRTVDRFLDDGDSFVTTFHYGPALAGLRTDADWVVDVYDDPYQYVFNNPRSVHEVLGRGLGVALSRADRAVHTVHPASPRLFGRERGFAVNGAAVGAVEPAEKPPRDPLRCVWAGRPRLDRGLDVLLAALARTDEPVAVEVFGDADDRAASLARQRGVRDDVTFRGRRPHQAVVEAIASAHVGLCLLPRREDWLYAYPIRVGEYLAGGAIPVCSPFYGMRALARDAGVYAEPAPTAVADALDALAACDRERFETLRVGARDRATAIDWKDERAWFARQALGDVA